MKLLLDTHIWIWSLNSPERLGRRVQKLLTNPSTELHLSPVSIWEAHLLYKRRNLRMQHSFADWLDRMLMRSPLKEAPFNLSVVREVCAIHLPQSDPGDLFLAATAAAYGLTLVTEDAQLLACKAIRTMPNH